MNEYDNALQQLFEVVKNRKDNPQEGSYTCYLFDKGLDKILKKCGEENAEMIIAAKNKDNDELANEMCDLLYHMVVLMVQNGLSVDEVLKILHERSLKIGNLKQFHTVDRES